MTMAPEIYCDCGCAMYVASLLVNSHDLQVRVRELEQIIDTRNTPLWKRVVFRVDGWPRWTVNAERPQWRPWRKWWTS